MTVGKNYAAVNFAIRCERLCQNTLVVLHKHQVRHRAAVEKELCRIGARYSIVNMKEIDISSTDIRERLKRGLSCSGLLDKRVEKYIIDNRLYR